MHTPGPWYFDKGGSNLKPQPDDCLGAIGADDWVLAEVKRDGPHPDADAEFIVLACNSHAKLLEALERALPALDVAWERAVMNIDAPMPAKLAELEKGSPWANAARDAIKLAKGE